METEKLISNVESMLIRRIEFWVDQHQRCRDRISEECLAECRHLYAAFHMCVNNTRGITEDDAEVMP